MNPDLAKERQNAAQFPMQEMTEFVWGKELLEIKERISRIIEKDPILARVSGNHCFISLGTRLFLQIINDLTHLIARSHFFGQNRIP